MRELDAILECWRRNPSAPGVLATVVHVEGSAYRRPGARMLISPGGAHIGTISGGCLEGDVARKAAWWTAGGAPALRVYDTMSDEDAAWEFGLGCNGVIHVLLEPLSHGGTQALLAHLDRCLSSRRDTVVATVIRCGGGRYRQGDHFFGSDMPAEFSEQAAAVLDARRSRLLHLPGADVFLEHVAPPQRLVVLGAGHDALPVVSSAASLGWDITVADVRSGYAKPSRFPGASSVVTIPPTGDVDLGIDADTAVVFMTHNFPLDTRLLPGVLAKRPRYVGLLGSWMRTKRLFEAAGQDLRGPHIHAPVGLDLGGESPESIALAIVAEIEASLHGRTAASLRWRQDPIHDAVVTVGRPSERLAEAVREPATCEIA
ncbi:MAG: XdhC family protein [Bryobacteraceae bacterium]